MRSDGSCDVASGHTTHRKIWRHLYGAIPPGHGVGTTCGTPLCVDHMALVIRMECRNGHAREPGTRCKRCGYEALMRWRRAHPEKARTLDRLAKRKQRGTVMHGQRGPRH